MPMMVALTTAASNSLPARRRFPRRNVARKAPRRPATRPTTIDPRIERGRFLAAEFDRRLAASLDADLAYDATMNRMRDLPKPDDLAYEQSPTAVAARRTMTAAEIRLKRAASALADFLDAEGLAIFRVGPVGYSSRRGQQVYAWARYNAAGEFVAESDDEIQAVTFIDRRPLRDMIGGA